MDFKEWKKYKLGEFVEVQNGYAFKSDDFTDKGIPVIKIKNIVSPRIQLEDAQYFNGEINLKLKQFLIKKGDTLISMTGSHINQIASAVGKIGRYQFDYPAMINQRVGKIYVTNEAIGNEDFLYYFLNQFETQFELAASAGGSANQANISPTQIKNLEILLPDIESQTRIAAILTSIDDKIELNRQTNATLEALAQTLFKEMCLPKNGEDTEGWYEGTIGDICSVQNGYAFKSNDFIEEGEIKIIKIRNISNNLVDVENTQFVNSLVVKNLDKKFKIEKGSLLIAMTGAEVGKIGLTPYSEKELWLNQRVGKFVEQIKFANHFLYILLSSPEYQNLLQNTAQGSAQPNISSYGIENIQTILPDNSIIEAYGSMVKPLFEKILSNIEETQTLTTLRDSLLPKLMKGEIAV